MRLYIDLETYSVENIRNVEVYRYSEHPEFQILMAAWSWGEQVRISLGHQSILKDLGGFLLDPSILLVAHNAQFERVCLSRLLGMPTGVYMPPQRWHDTMAVAAEQGLPRSLSALAKALGAPDKDTAGTRLINLFCRPNSRTKARVLPEEKPREWVDFMDYCAQDVETLVAVDRALEARGGWPTEGEHAAWVSDQDINDRGVRMDLLLARHAVHSAALNAESQLARVRELSGVDNPNSQPQMMEWISREGLGATNLRAETVSDLLSGSLTPEQREVLELRQELALVASKKFQAALSGTSPDGRYRGGFRFFGAHTGRWSGKGPQLQNLPRETLKPSWVGKDAPEEEFTAAQVALTEAAAQDVLAGFGADASTLKALVRAMVLLHGTVVDYAAIEARVIAWLAHEEWALEAFHSQRDIYVETAERMSAATKTTQYTRFQGKVAVLALGYNGGVNSLRNMGADGDDATLQMLVSQWRRANPRIVSLWETAQDAFGAGGPVGEHVRVETHQGNSRIRLPSGRAIEYHDVKWERYRVAHPDTGQMVPKEGWRFRDPKTGSRIGTYGGRLCENITQAVARDLLAAAIVRLQRAGHRVVGHVHDEVWVEGERDVDAIRAIMNDNPPWAKGLPVDSAGFTCGRYRKG